MIQQEASPRTQNSVLIAVLCLFALTMVVRVVPAWFLNAEVADLISYCDMADAALRGDNIYARHVLFPYTPWSLFIPATMSRLAEVLGWRFDFVVKLPSCLADGFTTVLIFCGLSALGHSRRQSLGWSLCWALNPVAILTSAFHGNLMATIPCLVTGALVAAPGFVARHRRALLLTVSAMLLGLAIAMRSFPVLMLPLFLFFATRTVREAILFTLTAVYASALSTLPYLIYAPQTFLREVFGYTGTPDFGWASIVRTMAHLSGGPMVSLFHYQPLLQMSKWLFLTSFAIVLLSLPFFGRGALSRVLLLPPLLFYGLYGGVAAQYLVWVIPMAILGRQYFVLAFSAVATVTMIAFYLLYHPQILFGWYPVHIEPTRALFLWYAWCNGVLVLTSIAWILRIVIAEFLSGSDAQDRDGWPALFDRPPLRWACIVLVLLFSALWSYLALSCIHGANEAYRAAIAGPKIASTVGDDESQGNVVSLVQRCGLARGPRPCRMSGRGHSAAGPKWHHRPQ